MTSASCDELVGTTVSTAALTLTEAHLVAWASLTGDWLPIHTDREFAARSGFGERVVHGPCTLAMTLGLSTRTTLIDDERTVAWLGLNELRAVAPVMIGDTIRAQVTVAHARPSHQENQHVVTLDYIVTNQRGEKVMTFSNVLLVADAPPGD